VDAALSHRAMRRRASDESVIDGVIHSMLLKQEAARRNDMARACRERLNAAALSEAIGQLGEIIQLGLVFGTTRTLDLEAFLVGPKACLPCATCPRAVHVIESVAFAGAYATCPVCASPRCLHCVNTDIECPTTEKTCRECAARNK
jgi:hypothetical protein